MEGFKPPEANNDNEQLIVGDWVTVTNERDARFVKEYLKAEPPYVIARIGPRSVSLIALKDRQTITGKEPAIEHTVANMSGTDTPSYGVSSMHLKKFDRLGIVRE